MNASFSAAVHINRSQLDDSLFVDEVARCASLNGEEDPVKSAESGLIMHVGRTGE